MTAASQSADLTAGRWRIPRSRGAMGGFLLMLCGIWAALIPFVGPYFNFAYTPNVTWHWTWARFWMDVLPGIGAFVGGFLLLMSRNRATAMLGGWLAAIAGMWLIVGTSVSMLWHHGTGYAGLAVRRQRPSGVGAIGLLLCHRCTDAVPRHHVARSAERSQRSRRPARGAPDGCGGGGRRDCCTR